jgi:DNA-binding beta-propeller fold protein YncE
MDSNALAVFDRSPTTGALTQKGFGGCLSEDGSGGTCTDALAMNAPSGIAISPDGRNVYLTSSLSEAVAVFDRNEGNGILTQKGGTAACVSETGTNGDCANGVALNAAWEVGVSPDGRNVYVLSITDDAVAVFDRDLSTGVLNQKPNLFACVSLSGTGGNCAMAVGLYGPEGVAASVDGRTVYVAASVADAIVVFDRNPSTGSLTQKAGLAGCAAVGGAGGLCANATALNGAIWVSVSGDDRFLYAASSESDALAAFTREVLAYDIDGSDVADPLTDGLLLMRYLFGFRGDALVTGAVDAINCTRCTAAQIEAYIGSLLDL